MHSRHLLDALYDFFATARALAVRDTRGDRDLLIGRPKRDACFQWLVVRAANERRQHGLIAAGRDVEKKVISTRFSIVKPSGIGCVLPARHRPIGFIARRTDIVEISVNEIQPRVRTSSCAALLNRY